MKTLLPFIIVGVTSGSLFGLAGVGLVLTYRTSGVFNFAHGAIGAAGAYLFYSLHDTYGWPWPIALVVVVAGFGSITGSVIERIMRRLVGGPEALLIVATVGLLLAINGVLFLAYGSDARNFPQFLPGGAVEVSGVITSYAQIITVIVASASAGVLYIFLRNSRLGTSMRGVVDNPTLYSLTGGRPARVRVTSWIIGAAFASLSGILIAPTIGLDATVLTLLVVQALGGAALGLFSNLPMTYLGGIAVGVLASVATKYLGAHPPFNGIPISAPFLVLLVVLLFVPARKLPTSRLALRGLVKGNQRFSMRTGVPSSLAVGIGLVILPFVVGSRLPVWTNALTMSIMFASLALLVWVSGQISLCHTAFAAFGATTLSHLTVDHGVPWGVALIAAGLATVPLGAIVAIPAIRVSGVYLALATFGLAILMQQVVYGSGLMFGDSPLRRAPRPVFFSLNGQNDRTYYFVVLAVAALVCVALTLLNRGRTGRLLRGMSETPMALSAHGLNVNMTRVLVFCISSFLAGVAGALTITQFSAVSILSFVPLQSLLWLTVLAICGTSLIGSSLLASLAIVVVPAYVTGFGANEQMVTFGVLAVTASVVVAKRVRRRIGARTVDVADVERASTAIEVGGTPAGVVG